MGRKPKIKDQIKDFINKKSNVSELDDSKDPLSIAKGIENTKEQEKEIKNDSENGEVAKRVYKKANKKITPKVCTKLVKLPYLFAEKLTKDECFKIEQEEIDELGQATSEVLSAFLPEEFDDKWTALIALGIMFGSSFGGRMLEWQNSKKQNQTNIK